MVNVEPSPKEQQLLDLSTSYDDALQSRDVEKLKSLLADNVVLHKDDITLQNDIVGKDAVAKYFEAYWEKYTYTHEPIAGAVDKDRMVAFCFAADKDVTPKRDAFPGLPEDAYKPRTTCGICKHEIDGDFKCKGLWFLRQLSNDELYRKVAKPPNLDALDLDPFAYKGSHKGQKAEYRQAHYQVTERFCEMYGKGDVSIADEILKEDVRQVQPILGTELRGCEKFKQHLAQTFKETWKPSKDEVDIAATAGDKSFVHWRSTGHDKVLNKEVSMYGLDMLVLSSKNRVKEVLNFSQILPSKRKELLKEE